jgi:LCP family protein required for cell wall assembly
MDPVTLRRRSPTIAAALSFLWPGLGQWYAGRVAEALFFAVPVALVLLLMVAWVAGGNIFDLLVPSVALTLLAIIFADALWRIWSGVRAAILAGGRDALTRPATGAAVIGLTLAVVVTHMWATAVAWSLFQAPGQVFAPPVAALPTPSLDPGAPPSELPMPSTAVTPPTRESRINILLTGIDKSSIRTHSLTDTLIAVSVDPATGDVAMLSFPRDISRFQEPDGTPFNHKINELLTYADAHPDEYPRGGMAALMEDIGFLLGVPIHYYAAIDLDGFAELIDAVGGVTVDNPKAINDPGYGGWTDGRIGFRLSAGVHHLDGQTALAYARSRKGAGDNDFTRSRRQQQLLLALRARLTDPTLLPQLPAIIDAGSRTVRTNFPQDRIREMLDIGSAITDDAAVQRVVLGPPYARNPPPGTPGGYQLILDMDRLARLSVELFGTDSGYATPTGASPAP